MKVQVSEATPIQLNWMVAKATGLLDAGRVVVDFGYMSGHDPIRLNPRRDVYYSSAYSPSTNWAQGGPIIEQQGIALYLYGDYQWNAHVGGRESVGPTALIAATRCYVAFELGDEVDVPDELI